MGRIWRFEIAGNMVKNGSQQRRKLTANGCNEPFRDRYWCPKKQWFQRDTCPFLNRRECENYEVMCGCL